VEELRRRTEEMLANYVSLAAGLGVPATARMAIGTEAVGEAERLCLEVAREFPQVVFFAGKMIFQKERWYHRLLHNETALAVEKPSVGRKDHGDTTDPRPRDRLGPGLCCHPFRLAICSIVATIA
jgi:hypothetical protein